MPPISIWWTSEALELLAHEDRLDDVYVGKVHACGRVRVVEGEDIARPHAIVVRLHQRLHRIWKRTKMQRHRQAVRDDAAMRVAQTSRIVHGIAHDG